MVAEAVVIVQVEDLLVVAVVAEVVEDKKIENLIYVVFDDIEDSDGKYKKINLIIK